MSTLSDGHPRGRHGSIAVVAGQGTLHSNLPASDPHKMTNPFSTAEMAEGYAKARPPLHSMIVERGVALAGLKPPLQAALDIGCGSGLSARPLRRLALRVVAFDPAHSMAAIAARIAEPAHAVTARAEALPFRPGCFNLVTAAGSLNYTDPSMVFPGVSRVLASGGCFMVYDFSQGRSSASSPDLAAWFDGFLSRYPMPPGEALSLNPAAIAEIAGGFTIQAAEEFQLAIPMEVTAYSAYLMTETNVAAAIRGGETTSGIRSWLDDSLAPIFGGDSLEISFSGYVVCLRSA